MQITELTDKLSLRFIKDEGTDPILVQHFDAPEDKFDGHCIEKPWNGAIAVVLICVVIGRQTLNSARHFFARK